MESKFIFSISGFPALNTAKKIDLMYMKASQLGAKPSVLKHSLKQ
jgi:hypothetical protein